MREDSPARRHDGGNDDGGGGGADSGADGDSVGDGGGATCDADGGSDDSVSRQHGRAVRHAALRLFASL
eukprot:2304657-Prymnesium_polylepis.1